MWLNKFIAHSTAQSLYFGRSEDGGYTWRRVTGGEQGWGPPGVRAGFPIDIQVDPRDPNRIFINNYGGGNFLSEDGGQSWTVASLGYTGAQVRAITVDPAQPSRVFAAARSGIFVSNHGGISWEGLNFPPVVSMEWNAVAIDPSDPQHIIASTNWGNLLLNSIDGGYLWKQVASFGEQRIGWRAIAFAPSDPKTVYAGSAGYFSAGSFDINQPGKRIYLSSDGGESWIQRNGILSENAHVAGLAVHPTDPKIVFAATTNYGLLGTTDSGTSWVTHNDSMLCQCKALAVAINPADPNIVFAGMEHNGVFSSTDRGQIWKHSSSGLNPEASISSIVFDPNNPLEVIYIADLFSGVYRSLDGGKTWNALNNNLSMRAINALSISSDGQHLYAASEGSGVFRLDMNGQPPNFAPNLNP